MKKIPITFHTIEVKNVKVFYRQAGDPKSPAILLLHGFPTSSHMFRDLISRLAEDYHVVAPDLPGFGNTIAPPRGEFHYTFDNLAAVMGSFVEAIGLKRFAMYVFDYGATYASGTGHENRHSFGSRIFGSRDGWDWNGEGVVQIGTFGDESIFAWTASLDSGYTWDAKLQPRLGLKVDVASGDNSNGHQGTFDPLYFKSGYFNDASMIRPANIIDVHPNLAANLTRTFSVNGGTDVFWRYSKDDAIYAPPGFIEIPALKTASSYVATAVDINLQWQIQRHLTFGASYVHFFTGSYVHQAGGSDVNFVSTTLSFLF